MIQLPHIQARVVRLRQLAEGIGREVTAQKAGDRLLLPQERRQYLDGMQDALAGLDEARVVLAGVVKRMEDGRG